MIKPLRRLCHSFTPEAVNNVSAGAVNKCHLAPPGYESERKKQRDREQRALCLSLVLPADLSASILHCPIHTAQPHDQTHISQLSPGGAVEGKAVVAGMGTEGIKNKVNFNLI